jgi:AraC family transcriptional regulator of adaptative response/methylated-DNA-[protein]-cysteine methyltransferase
MLETVHPIGDLRPADLDPSASASDYALVRRAIALIARDFRDQPSAEAIAAAVGVSPPQLAQLFRRWARLTPKAFCQAVTLDHARRLLRADANLLDAAYELGLSGPGRLHDLFVTHEAMSPGEYARRGAGLLLRYGFHASPFGEALVVVTHRGLAAIGWVDEGEAGAAGSAFGKAAGGREGALADMRRRWPEARFAMDAAATAPYARRVFDPARWRPEEPLRIVMIGSDFEVRVWQALLKVPMAGATTYGRIAAAVGAPRAARAVGAAVGRNPLSFVVPCHRVLSGDGRLTGYHWGLTRKRAILGWEAGAVAG